MDKMTEDALSQFAESNETINGESKPVEKKKRVVTNPDIPGSDPKPRRIMQAEQQENLFEARERVQNEAREYSRSIGAGFVEVPVNTLPTQGIFYPEGTKLMIRAASGAEIRHWSTIGDDDLSVIDDAINYVLERCVTVKFPEGCQIATWKDLKELDRFYLILAIRDFTFTEGNNDLEINVSETQRIKVHKDDINFMRLPDSLMKYYNPDTRCFNIRHPRLSREINIYMPSVGVSQWLKGYVQKKAQRQEGFDQDFIQFAPLLIKDYRGLNDANYEAFVLSCMDYGQLEYSLLSKIRKMISEAITPKLVYIDESGAEQEAPLNFRGGIHSIFLMDLDDIL